MAKDVRQKNDAAQPSHGGFERRDIGTAGILYFLAGLAAATIIVHFLLAGLYDFMDKRARSEQPPVSPLIANVPTDTRRIPPTYPERAFPEPRLETDERNQLGGFRLNEEEELNSYGWVNQDAGIVRIPIDRAMDLLVQRGLPVRPPETTQIAAKTENQKKGSNR
jgi:hypothetical protein